MGQKFKKIVNMVNSGSLFGLTTRFTDNELTRLTTDFCEKKGFFLYRGREDILVGPTAARIDLATSALFEHFSIREAWENLLNTPFVLQSQMLPDLVQKGMGNLLLTYLDERGVFSDLSAHIAKVWRTYGGRFNEIPLHDLFFWLLLEKRVTHLDLTSCPFMTKQRVDNLLKIFTSLETLTLDNHLQGATFRTSSPVQFLFQ